MDFAMLFGAEPETEPELGLVCFQSIDRITPSPENDSLYRPMDPQDPALRALAESIRTLGIQEPLAITRDWYILSGHRRYAAARLIGLKEVPCRMVDVWHCDTNFVCLLREQNRQREKTDSEKLREVIVSANPEEAYQALLEHREKTSDVDLPTFDIHGEKVRSEITSAKIPFLNAAIEVMKRLQKFWPLSLRQIHYQLLNDPPLIHAKKPDSVYQNKPECYKALSELLTRARIIGHIPMDIIQDETRSSTTWSVHQTTTPFLEKEINDFLKNYRRDLQQSQPCHLEVCLEKNTVKGVLEPVAGRYSIPVTTMRGYTSVPPRHAIVERFRKSGKEKLVLLVMSDFDPDGEEIAHSLARSIRDDFHIEAIHPVKVGLTFEQVTRLQLPPSLEAKPSSSNYKKFEEKYGPHAYELEAVQPEQLQRWLREAIDNVMDLDAFNAERVHEKADSAHLENLRRKVSAELKASIEEKTD